MEERERERERDDIGAILEEVINRCESKIDLFCNGSKARGRRRAARILSLSLSLFLCPRLHAHIYIIYNIYILIHKTHTMAE